MNNSILIVIIFGLLVVSVILLLFAKLFANLTGRSINFIGRAHTTTIHPKGYKSFEIQEISEKEIIELILLYRQNSSVVTKENLESLISLCNSQMTDKILRELESLMIVDERIIKCKLTDIEFDNSLFKIPIQKLYREKFIVKS